MRWTVITFCDSFFITKCNTVYSKLRQVLQSAMNLLQIATGITKCDDYYKLRQYKFITKCDGQLLQIATAFLLQSATRFITNCDRYYKVRWMYYKLRQVLQSAMIITNCDGAPT